MKFYSLKKLNKIDATYRIAFGERSNGKTFACLEELLKTYATTGKQGAYLRRWDDDFKGKRGQTLFNAIVAESKVWKELYSEEWDSIKYKSAQWWLFKHDDDLNVDVWSDEPICYGFALSTMEHDKSSSYPNIGIIIFDEFLTRRAYLPDEFVLFMNVISTIVRHRTDVRIYMIGNTVNKTCPYFTEMGLTNVSKMKAGKIDVYHYGESKLTVAVEYCAPNNEDGKPSDVYFAFNNPKLQMITGGAWEMAMYPHLPIKYKPKDIRFTYFIQFEMDLLQCEIIYVDDMRFTYIHRKTTELQNPETDLVYCPDQSPRPNWSRRITKCRNKMENEICRYFIEEKVFYQDNEVGEIVRNYLQFCKTASII